MSTLEFRVAESRADVLRCQNLVASVYNVQYGVVFSDDCFDLDAKVEPWPRRFLMLLVDGELAATIGLYVGDTYVERFGAVTDAELRAAIARAPGRKPRAALEKREVTKLVVGPRWRGKRLGIPMLAAGHSDAFTRAEASDAPLMICCGKLSIFRSQYDRARIQTRVLKPFPYYKVHERYRSPEDPMESRLTVPELDVPDFWRELRLSGSYSLADIEAQP